MKLFSQKSTDERARNRTSRVPRVVLSAALLLLPSFATPAHGSSPAAGSTRTALLARTRPAALVQQTGATITPGMTMRQVRAAWGDPRLTNRNVTKGRVTETWHYAGDRRVEFEDGEVVAATPASARAAAAPPRDTAGVRAAALDYLEGFYLGDSTRFIRSIRPEVFKYGFSRDASGAYRGMQMRWPEFHQFAGRVKAGAVKTPANAPKQIEVLDIADQTAAVKVTAWWGIDYLLMAKTDGRWMIHHVMWQSPPRA